MKRFLAVALASLALAIPVSASVEDVEKFLEPYTDELNWIEATEFYDPEYEKESKSILIEYHYPVVRDGETTEIHKAKNRKRIFLDMINQDWCDYDKIQFLGITNGYSNGITDFYTYRKPNGTIVDYMTNRVSTWFTLKNDEISDELRSFLGYVTADVLHSYNIWDSDPFALYNGKGADFQFCNTLAVVSGKAESDGKTYNYTIEFQFEFMGGYNGEYKTEYLNVNDVTLMGEYKPIEDYSWKIS